MLLLTACASTPTPARPERPELVVLPAAVAPVVPVVPAAPVVPVVPPDPAELMCAGVEAGPEPEIRVGIEAAVLECPEGQLDRCHGESRFVVANCGAEPVRLERLVFTRPGSKGWMMVEPAEGELAQRRSWTWTTKVFRESSELLRVEVVDMHGVPIRVAEQPVVVANPTREAAMAACTACNGTWGIRGLVYREACNCAARDAGQECRDGDACEGRCVFDRWEVSTPAQPLRCKGKTCSARVAGIGRPVGRCSSRVALRSCHRLLQAGVAAQPDQPLPWGVSTVCID